MKKGFTLIELLAVIVILAIIALIATPIILGIINDAKEDSNKRSVENYAHAVELAIARDATKQGGVIEEGDYTIGNDGKTIISPSGKEITIDYKGEEITGTVNVDAKGKISLSEIQFDGGEVYYSYTEEDGVTSSSEGSSKEITHLLLPDGTLVYYKGKGDVKLPATIDGTQIKKISFNAISNSNVILFNYDPNPAQCSADSSKCVDQGIIYSLDLNLSEADLRKFGEEYVELDLVADVIYPTSSEEIIEDYNNLVAQGIEVEAAAGYVKFENGQPVGEGTYETDITSLDLSEVTNLEMIDEFAVTNLQNLKTITLPSNITRVRVDAFSNCPNLESIIVPYKDSSEIPSTWSVDWNLDEVLDVRHNVIYNG